MADDLNDLRFAAAVADAGSLAGAARLLGVNHATAFRRIVALESRLGVRLFERKAGRYWPTAAGEELARAGRNIAAEATQSMRLIAGQDLRPGGVVRITTTDAIHAALLAGLLPLCREQLPDIQLHLCISNESRDLSRRDADIAIRSTRKPPEHLVGRRIGPLQMTVYGSRGYLKSRQRLELAAHDWLGLDESLSYHRSLRWLAGLLPLERLVYRANSFVALREACVAGIGVAVLPCFLADGRPGLRRLTPPLAELQSDLWLLMHPDLRRTARVAAVFEWLHQQSAAQLARLADAA